MWKNILQVILETLLLAVEYVISNVLSNYSLNRTIILVKFSRIIIVIFIEKISIYMVFEVKKSKREDFHGKLTSANSKYV